MLKVGVFGGSFDPVHIEHTQIIKTVLKEFKINKIIVVPAYNPPHKKFLNVSEYHRLNMLKFALKNMKNVVVDTFEIDLKRVVYTFETLDYLQSKYSNTKLKLIIGSDSYNQLNNWKKSEYIAKKYGFIVVNRQNIEINEHSIFFKYSAFSKFKGSISSTLIRDYIKEGKNISDFMNKEVLNYIKEYKLYE